jgi:hypothetical protein
MTCQSDADADSRPARSDTCSMGQPQIEGAGGALRVNPQHCHIWAMSQVLDLSSEEVHAVHTDCAAAAS